MSTITVTVEIDGEKYGATFDAELSTGTADFVGRIATTAITVARGKQAAQTEVGAD